MTGLADLRKSTGLFNRGYRLVEVPDLMTAPVVEHFLPPDRKAPVYAYEELDSTITQGQRMVLEGVESGPFVILLALPSFINYFIFTWPFWSMKLGFARRRADPQVINFKKAQRQAQKKARETGGYLHKCAVCGLTDQDDPNMEFRYCSKCDGYYCYCANHINNHIHIHND